MRCLSLPLKVLGIPGSLQITREGITYQNDLPLQPIGAEW